MDNIEEMLSDKKINTKMKKTITSTVNADTIAKAITHFAFRNGPIEDMHANREKQITDEDMKILNKFMHNRLTYVFELILKDRWAEFAFLIDAHKFYGSQWDKAEPDDGGMKKYIQWQLELVSSRGDAK
jgi:hypothetical protein